MLLAATVRSFVHMQLGLSGRNITQKLIPTISSFGAVLYKTI